MTFTETHRDCRKCGRSFKRSATDRTVNCMDCRTTHRSTVSESRLHDAHYAMAMAQKAGRDFRREHGHDDDKLIAAFKYASERYHDLMREATR